MRRCEAPQDYPQICDAGADMETRCLDKTALHMASASSSESADIMRQLVIHGADLNAECKDWGLYDDDVNWSPLHAAIDRGHRDMVFLLLEAHQDSVGNPILPYWAS